jgi:FG-GAP-like repeat/FG-GAP repeat
MWHGKPPGKPRLAKEIDNNSGAILRCIAHVLPLPSGSKRMREVTAVGIRRIGVPALLGLVLAALTLSSWSLRARADGDPPASMSGPTAASQEWLVDDQGRQYRIERLDKKLRYLRLDGNRVRSYVGIDLDLAGEDEQSFLYKVYRDTGGLGPSVQRSATPEEKAKIAATYQFDLPPSRTMRFEAFDEGLPRSAQWRHGFVLVDMNGDGHLDIVHGPPRRGPGGPLIFLGDGAGHWRRWQTSFPAQRYDYGNVAVADFNGDGHLDIAMGMHLLGVTVLLGDGAGHFRAASSGLDPLDPGTAFSSHALAAVDWDGDGHVDLIALSEGPRLATKRSDTPGAGWIPGVVFYRNRGDATWEKRIAREPKAGDALVVAPRRSGERPWLVMGSIEPGLRDLVLRPGAPVSVEALPGVRPGALVRTVAFGDFDGDGHDDIAIAYGAYEGEKWRSGIDLVLTRPGGAPERRTVYVVEGSEGVTALAAGDLDGDGRVDLVALTGDGEVLVLRNAGGGTFTREEAQFTERAAGCRGYHVEVRDLDKDGRADIVASFAGEPVGIGGALGEQGCPAQGSLRAWRSRPRS